MSPQAMCLSLKEICPFFSPVNKSDGGLWAIMGDNKPWKAATRPNIKNAVDVAEGTNHINKNSGP
jgi:hypothetical protein